MERLMSLVLLIEAMTSGQEPGVGDERGAALVLALLVQRRLPGPGAGTRVRATHDPDKINQLVINQKSNFRQRFIFLN